MIKRSEIVKIPIREFFHEENYWKLKEMIDATIEAVKYILLGYGKLPSYTNFRHEETQTFMNYIISHIEREYARDQEVYLDLEAMITADNSILLCIKYLN